MFRPTVTDVAVTVVAFGSASVASRRNRGNLLPSHGAAHLRSQRSATTHQGGAANRFSHMFTDRWARPRCPDGTGRSVRPRIPREIRRRGRKNGRAPAHLNFRQCSSSGSGQALPAAFLSGARGVIVTQHLLAPDADGRWSDWCSPMLTLRTSPGGWTTGDRELLRARCPLRHRLNHAGRTTRHPRAGRRDAGTLRAVESRAGACPVLVIATFVR